MLVQLINEVMRHYECFSDVYKILSLLTALSFFKKCHFSSYDAPAMIDSNPDNSAISKL
jgi:hypothetical protein